MGLKQSLKAIFEADRALHQAEDALFQDGETPELKTLLSDAVREANGLSDRGEAAIRLSRLADLCAQVTGPEMADALLMILNDEDPQVRVAAGEALRDVGFERYAEVARAVERFTKQVGDDGGQPALSEIPWILVEIGEPSAIKLIAPILANEDGEIVASAVEALADLGDPAAVPHLRTLVDDAREITLDDSDDEEPVPLGELVREAVEALEAKAQR